MSENDKNFDIFELLVNFEPFSNRSLQYFFKRLLDYQLRLVESLPSFWLQNKSTQIAQKQRCWNVLTPLEGFSNVFEAKRCNVLLKKYNT